jgi:hypothetical protein
MSDRHAVVDIVVVMGGETQLFEVVFALSAAGGFAGLLNGWEEQSDEDRDDRDHHEQFDERETTPIGPLSGI